MYSVGYSAVSSAVSSAVHSVVYWVASLVASLVDLLAVAKGLKLVACLVEDLVALRVSQKVVH